MQFGFQSVPGKRHGIAYSGRIISRYPRKSIAGGLLSTQLLKRTADKGMECGVGLPLLPKGTHKRTLAKFFGVRWKWTRHRKWTFRVRQSSMGIRLAKNLFFLFRRKEWRVTLDESRSMYMYHGIRETGRETPSRSKRPQSVNGHS